MTGRPEGPAIKFTMPMSYNKLFSQILHGIDKHILRIFFNLSRMNISPRRYDFRGNLVSQTFLIWTEKLFLNGYRNTLNQDDLFPCPSEQSSEYLFAKFDRYWKFELEKAGRPDIKIALARTVKCRFFLAGVFCLIESFFVLTQSVLISHFVAILSDSNKPNSTTFTDNLPPSLAYAVVISVIIIGLMINRSIGNNYIYYNGMQLRSICTTALFKKTMRLQQATLHRTFIGHIINLISNDVYKLEFGAVYWPYLWVSPIILLFSVVLVWVYIGPIGLIGILYMILHVPLQFAIGFLFGKFRYLQSVIRDERIELMHQIIRGIRVIKLYVWENSFLRYVRRIRSEEVRYAGLAGFCRCITFSLFNSSLFIALFLVYMASTAISLPLTSSQLAFAFILFNKIRFDIILYVGNAILTYRESIVALGRIQKILWNSQRLPTTVWCSLLWEFLLLQ